MLLVSFCLFYVNVDFIIYLFSYSYIKQLNENEKCCHLSKNKLLFFIFVCLHLMFILSNYIYHIVLNN